MYHLLRKYGLPIANRSFPKPFTHNRFYFYILEHSYTCKGIHVYVAKIKKKGYQPESWELKKEFN